jgi:hypothetical protein
MVASKSFASLPIAPDPDEEPLDDPAPRVNSEADLIGVFFAQDLDRDQRGLGDLLTGIPAFARHWRPAVEYSHSLDC